MTLFRVATDKLEEVPATTFAAESLLERKDLQRLLRCDISCLGEELLVLADEYGEWEDSSRRIDLLCLNKSADCVVVEIKRTEDGGHMDLQAIRYAAMVSSMTLDQAIAAYAQGHKCEPEAARSKILEFLQWESAEEAELTGEVRIFLVAANFSTELTTSVLWLNRHDLDITCIRLRPYRLGSDVLIDATQIIPLPEASEYEVKLRAQEKEKQKVHGAKQELFRRFWAQLIERSKAKTPLFANRSTTTDQWITAGIGRSGFALHTNMTKTSGKVECYIRLPGGEKKSTAAFRMLEAKKAEIEATFGGPLVWEELPGREGCRISKDLPDGWTAPESEWPAMQDRIIDGLIRLEAALKKPIQELKL